MLNMDVSTVLANGDFNRHIKRKYITDKDLPLCFTQERHTESIQGVDYVAHKWRMKERMKTVSVALVICLNVGVDPPDVVKTQPCARLECWIDPLSMSPNKALEKVGANLQAQYERWQPRARYKQSLDPTTDEVKKLCTSLRRNAKEERVLFHYNGHGVPKPTTNGEIWVFNRTYTQYIPLSIYDLQAWMGAPSIYVYDCSNAGIIVDSFKQYASQHELEYTQTKPPPTTPRPEFEKCIQLAACSATQVLPMNPELPADLFTACLTTPIKVALRWFVHQSTSKLVPKVTLEEIDRIPGQITDRRTMIGELNWIFTAITDTIAWNTLPRELFQKLFRQDLLVASLFRNFLLAERIMRSCDCSPVSSPPLPPTYQHPMWNAWDLALDLSLGQLPNIIKNNEPFQHLPFFEEQLTAFQVWLELGSEDRHPPEQLPIVLQVLLSQVHRMRALELLGKFLDLGPWAVNLALSVGIFPYILKLLQSSAKELRPLLVFIWAKILAVDNTCQTDLVRDNSHKYFLMVLQDGTLSPEHRTQAAFVLACIVNDYPEGKSVAMQSQLVSICLEQLNDGHQHLRQWVTICLGRLWDHYEEARWTGVRDIAHEKLYELLHDPCPEVRAAAVFALGTFINSCAERTNHANNIDQSVVIKLVNTVREDLSSLVRQELVNALQWFVLPFETSFINVASTENTSSFNIPDVTLTPTCLKRIGSRDRLRIGEDSAERLKRVSSSSSLTNLTSSGSFGSVYTKIWSALCNLESDPYPEVAKMAGIITKHIRSQVKEQARDVVDCKNPSLSLPPSPNRGGYLSGESPPTLLLSPVGKYSLKPYYVPFQKKKPKPYTISEESDDIFNKEKSLETSVTNRLVATNFIEWSCKRFAQSVKKENTFQDIESKSFYERDWRYVRNNNIRKEAIDEQKKALSCKLESQFFNTRTAVPPTLLQFHPFDQQIAVAGNDSFGIWDWGTGAKTTVCKNKSAKQPKGSPITALEWINGHDNAMLMVAADDGSVKIYRPNVGQSREPRLVTAWQAFDRLYQPKISGVLLAWEQWTQTVITAGDAKCIRFWDVEQELHSFDLPTGTDYVTCIDSTYVSNAHENFYNVGTSIGNNNLAGRVVGPKSGQIVAGGADGSVMLFDRRCPASEARVHLWVEHSDKVLDVQLKENLIVSGSADGDVKLYDIRANSCISTKQVQPNGMSCISFHRHASTYACGSLNQTISIYNLKGNQLNTIRFYEGFMGHRIGPVTCLNYHPYKVVLAAGTSDCSISVYCLDGRR